MRGAFSYLRENLGEDVASAQLVICGTSAVLVRDGQELIDVVNRTRGQGVLNLLALDDVRSQVDDAIQIRPGAGAAPGAPGRPAADGPLSGS